MGFKQRWLELWLRDQEELEPDRKLKVESGFNVRELGGYLVDDGATSYRRFLRSGGRDMLSAQDQRRLYNYGVRMVVDLRGYHEVSIAGDKLSKMPEVRTLHAPLYDVNLSDPALERNDSDGSYWTLGYLTMLANHDVVRDVFSFFATASPDDCVLFHCAAGMDRTGMVGMLLLGLVGANREQVIADYLYSFAPIREVDALAYKGVKPVSYELDLRLEAITTVLDRLKEGYGTTESYLLSCGVTADELSAVRRHLLAE